MLILLRIFDILPAALVCLNSLLNVDAVAKAFNVFKVLNVGTFTEGTTPIEYAVVTRNESFAPWTFGASKDCGDGSEPSQYVNAAMLSYACEHKTAKIYYVLMALFGGFFAVLFGVRLYLSFSRFAPSDWRSVFFSDQALKSTSMSVMFVIGSLLTVAAFISGCVELEGAESQTSLAIALLQFLVLNILGLNLSTAYTRNFDFDVWETDALLAGGAIEIQQLPQDGLLALVKYAAAPQKLFTDLQVALTAHLGGDDSTWAKLTKSKADADRLERMMLVLAQRPPVEK